MAISLADAIEKMEILRFQLEDPVEFYRENLDRFKFLAMRTVERTLEGLRPQDVPEEVWAELSKGLALRVTAYLVTDGGTGILIAMDVPAGDKLREVAGLPGDAENLPTIEEVEQWVAAGRSKTNLEDPGKNLGEIDEGKTDLQIAWRVYFALKLRKKGWNGLLEAIHDFLQTVDLPTAQNIAEAIAAAWEANFAALVPGMWREWVGLKMKEAF